MLVMLQTLTTHRKTSKLHLDTRNERRSLESGLFNQRPASVAFMPIILMINPLKVLIFCAHFPLLTVFSLALHFITPFRPFCCDCHDDDFSLEAMPPEFLYTGAINIIPVPTKTQKHYCPTWERPSLDELLIVWVETEVSQDRLLVQTMIFFLWLNGILFNGPFIHKSPLCLTLQRSLIRCLSWKKDGLQKCTRLFMIINLSVCQNLPRRWPVCNL